MDLLQNQFFSYFSGPGVKVLRENAKEISCKDQQVLFEEGDASDDIYLVLDGEILLTKRSEGGRIVTIARARAGEYFGELGVLDGSVRSARATCQGTTCVATIGGQVLLRILHAESAHTTLFVFKRILEHLRGLNDRYVAEVLRKEKLHLVGEMAGMIIHDFKNPITAIRLGAELIGSKHDDAITRETCDIVIKQTRRMVTMVQELLDFSKGATRLTVEVRTVGSLFEEFKALNPELFKARPARITLKPLEARIMVDPGRMLRVIQNLVMNALEALDSKKGGEVILAGREEGDRVEIFVQDDGPGIPENIRSTVFEPFITYGKKTGTGLGMAIARMIVEAHKGQITFTTETGKGTTFLIRLPKAV